MRYYAFIVPFNILSLPRRLSNQAIARPCACPEFCTCNVQFAAHSQRKKPPTLRMASISETIPEKTEQMRKATGNQCAQHFLAGASKQTRSLPATDSRPMPAQPRPRSCRSEVRGDGQLCIEGEFRRPFEPHKLVCPDMQPRAYLPNGHFGNEHVLQFMQKPPSPSRARSLRFNVWPTRIRGRTTSNAVVL